jgi:gliding motility-associated-like protein
MKIDLLSSPRFVQSHGQDGGYRLLVSAFLVSVLSTLSVWGQSHTIVEPQVNACLGGFLDSGGEGASGYSDNEDFTSTICADGPGLGISLSFVLFNLSTDGSAPGDQLVIYDGPDVNAPIIGTYGPGQSPGNVSASFTNTSGCLTLHWTSNETGTGVWAASLFCEVPCDPPTAIATMSQPAPALICQGESLTFNASGSVPGAGHTIQQYLWNFDDGTLDSLTGAVITHTFQNPGEYVVQVTLSDEIGCNNNNLIDLVVRVSTTPIFNFVDVTQYCFGQPVDLSVTTLPTEWTDLPANNLGDPEPLPDLQGVPFTTDIEYTIFPPGSTLVNVDQLESICVNMEHSYMGDLVIQLTCPNGQTVNLHEQGGGGTYLGGANDTDSGSDIQLGECWEYCWTPTATNGTWAENSEFGITPNVTQGGTPVSAALTPGIYESVQPFSQLQGCPLNGTWTFTVTDLFAIDNGSICSWSLSFDPALYPDLTTFTPVLGTGSSDSTIWTGSGFTVDPGNPQSGVAIPTAVGPNTYSVSVTDNFGCTYSDDVTITVIPGPTSAWTATPPSPQPVGTTTVFNDASTSNGSPVTHWTWYLGGELISTTQTFTQTFEVPGSYEVLLITETSNGCIDTLRLFYEVLPDDIGVPNVFSPNGDGQNDFLEFKNAQFLRENKLRVYSRWGNLVFESDNYTNGWSAPGVSEGTYFYTLGLKDGRNFDGHVTLLR